MQTKLSLVNPERSTRPFDFSLASADFLNTQNKWSLSSRISPYQDRRKLNLQGQNMQNNDDLSQRHCSKIILTIYSDCGQLSRQYDLGFSSRYNSMLNCDVTGVVDGR